MAGVLETVQLVSHVKIYCNMVEMYENHGNT